MNAATETSESFVAPTTAPRPVRPFYWSVMRELWENRSLFIAPAVVGALAIVIAIYVAIANGRELRAVSEIPPEMIGMGATIAYGAIAGLMSFVLNIAVFFYLLDALQGERKDRSVLFWKSMPVSDTTTVLAKMFTALLVSGAIVVVLAFVTQLVVLMVASVVMLIVGASPAPLWINGQMPQMIVTTIYWQLSLALWYAPVAAWLLFVSAWAKRVTILWAVLTPFAIAVFERVAMRTRYVWDTIFYRLKDPVAQQFLATQKGAQFSVGSEGVQAHGTARPVLDSLDPGAFLSNPWLWVGLIVAAGFVAASIWMRRYREPL
jgi:ABC-2 type transport system permease protein